MGKIFMLFHLLLTDATLCSAAKIGKTLQMDRINSLQAFNCGSEKRSDKSNWSSSALSARISNQFWNLDSFKSSSGPFINSCSNGSISRIFLELVSSLYSSIIMWAVPRSPAHKAGCYDTGLAPTMLSLLQKVACGVKAGNAIQDPRWDVRFEHWVIHISTPECTAGLRCMVFIFWIAIGRGSACWGFRVSECEQQVGSYAALALTES